MPIFDNLSDEARDRLAEMIREQLPRREFFPCRLEGTHQPAESPNIIHHELDRWRDRRFPISATSNIQTIDSDLSIAYYEVDGQRFDTWEEACQHRNSLLADEEISPGYAFFQGYRDAIEDPGIMHLPENHPYHAGEPIGGGSGLTRSVNVSDLRFSVPPSGLAESPDVAYRRPAACQGCQHYVGFAPQYGSASSDRLICAMHPYGPEADECEDREEKPTATPNGTPDPVRLNTVAMQISLQGQDARELTEVARRLAEQINNGGLYGFAPSPEQLEQQRRDEHWATDPLGIHEWLSSETGLMLRNVANGLGDISEAIDAIARWLRDLADDLI